MKGEHLKPDFWFSKAAVSVCWFSVVAVTVGPLAGEENSAFYLNTEAISVGAFCSHVFFYTFKS